MVTVLEQIFSGNKLCQCQLETIFPWIIRVVGYVGGNFISELLGAAPQTDENFYYVGMYWFDRLHGWHQDGFVGVVSGVAIRNWGLSSSSYWIHTVKSPPIFN